jgi:hypothetical protein
MEESSNKDKSDSRTILHMQEFSSALTPDRLDDTNYVEWSLNAQNKIQGRKRWAYVSRTKVAPKDEKSDE